MPYSKLNGSPDFVTICVESSAKYERMMELLSQELDMRKNETIERERNHRGFIAALREDNDKVFNDAVELINCMEQDMVTSDSFKVRGANL